MLKRFLAYYKPHKKIFIADMLAALLISLIAVLMGNTFSSMLSDVSTAFIAFF